MGQPSPAVRALTTQPSKAPRAGNARRSSCSAYSLIHLVPQQHGSPALTSSGVSFENDLQHCRCSCCPAAALSQNKRTPPHTFGPSFITESVVDSVPCEPRAVIKTAREQQPSARFTEPAGAVGQRIPSTWRPNGRACASVGGSRAPSVYLFWELLYCRWGARCSRSYAQL